MAAAPSLSTSDRLDARRYVAAGTRGYVVGTEAGRFPAMGFHTRGEMGGFWSPPVKLLDGLWFGVNGQWIGPATRFTSQSGYAQMDLPAPSGLQMRRVDFGPDGHRAVLVGLRIRSTGAARTVDVQVDAHSELMNAYPWGETTPSQSTVNGPDSGAFEGGRLVFRDGSFAAAVGARQAAASAETGPGFRGPQDPAVICPASGEGTPTPPPRCDDTAYGKGSGGRLHYRVKVPAHARTTLWLAVTGSETGSGTAVQELASVVRDPEALLRRKVAARARLQRFTRLSLPGDRLLQRGVDWSKQNLADSLQAATDLDLRETNSGKTYPPPAGKVARARWIAAGFPDYPWLFATDGEYTAFASVAAGQFAPIKDHLKALRDVSEIVNKGSGKVVHEVVSDGSVYFGSNADAGNTDETVKFPSAVALVWRWTGDNRFRDDLYGFSVRNMRYVFDQLDADHDGWPEGLGNVERPGMGEEKLDVSVYAIRGLRDLAEMARSKGDTATVTWAEGRARAMEAAFENAWWVPNVPQHADSLKNPGNEKVMQRHWIGVTPMEAELVGPTGRPEPGLTTRDHAIAALTLREQGCYGNDAGLFHTGSGGCDPAPSSKSDLEIFSLNSAVMAVGEGNYGRLDHGQQQRFTRANRQLQLPAPDEQPGAMPEIAPSPDYGRSILKSFLERASVLQAWGAYGTVWPVVHQQLGVRPDLGFFQLEITPQVPPYQHAIAGRGIRVGDRSVDVVAAHRGKRYETRVVNRFTQLRRVTVGATLPAGASVRSVTFDGRRVGVRTRTTNRGLEVLVRTPRVLGHHKLVVKAR
jgi:hypothetical protein